MNILGVGGHAKVVIDAVKSSSHQIQSVYDDDPKAHNTEFCGFQVQGSIDSSIDGNSVIAIGSNQIRKKISQRVTKVTWKSVIHPSAIVADDVEIGEGTVIMAGAVIQPGTKIGKHCIVNTGACIDHDCEIEDFCHIAPNCSVAGGVTIGEGTFICIGTAISHYVSIGSWATVGAGAAVIEDIPDNCTAVGVPAKPIKFHK
jgi:acetyltransferase EpsM